jgi:hypothetical protein
MTRFLSCPPFVQDVGARTLMTYKGKRVIYIGEGRGGGTGDDQMHRILDKDWTEVDSGEPVQWWGVHDLVTVYERGARHTELRKEIAQP